MSVLLPIRERYAILASMLIFAVTIRAVDFQRWITDKTLFEQDVLSAIMQAAPGLDADATIVLLVRPDNDEVLEHLNNSTTFQSALHLLYNDPQLNARICYLNESPWGWNNEFCEFVEDGLHTTYFGSEIVYSYDKLVVFEYTRDGDTILLQELPSDIVLRDVATIYRPMHLIDVDAPLPEHYYTMFNPRSPITR